MVSPIPDQVQLGNSPVYKVEKLLGRGGFGKVYLGRKMRDASGCWGQGPFQVAIKFEKVKRHGRDSGPPFEWQAYDYLDGCAGLARVYHKGRLGDYYVMVMDVLGPSLWDVRINSGRVMPPDAVARIAVQAIPILKNLHERGFVHGDVKPQNFLMGRPGSRDKNRLFLVDHGLASIWRDCKSGQHVKYMKRWNHPRGTLMFSSMRAQEGMTPTRTDDLESLAYTLVFLLEGALPWNRYVGDDQILRTKLSKFAWPCLCNSCPPPFKYFLDAVKAIPPTEEPNYAHLISFFGSIINPCINPWSARIYGIMKGGETQSRLSKNLDEKREDRDENNRSRKRKREDLKSPSRCQCKMHGVQIN